MIDRDSREKLEEVLGRRPTLEELGVRPAPSRGQGASYDNARSQFPSVKAGVEDWVGLFDHRPEVMLQILGDIFRESKALELRESGTAPTGRRPKAINGSLAELNAMITPQYSVEPFAVAVVELQGKRSLRAFAAKVPMNHHTLTRMMRGEVKLEKWRLEAIAKAAKVSPAFFMEWRVLYVQEALHAAFLAEPNLGIRAVRQLQRGRAER